MLSTYADVTVVGGPVESQKVERNGRVLGEALLNPTVIVEVLSDSTAEYDRGEKFAHYMKLPSLKEYVLVSQDRARIEVFHKPERGHWLTTSQAQEPQCRSWASRSPWTPSTAGRTLDAPRTFQAETRGSLTPCRQPAMASAPTANAANPAQRAMMVRFGQGRATRATALSSASEPPRNQLRSSSSRVGTA